MQAVRSWKDVVVRDVRLLVWPAAYPEALGRFRCSIGVRPRVVESAGLIQSSETRGLRLCLHTANVSVHESLLYQKVVHSLFVTMMTLWEALCRGILTL